MEVTWTDASDDEIGFRVDRSLDDGKTWAMIAYRPLHDKWDDPDALVWVDFTASSGKPLRYRVAALAAAPDEGAAGTAALPLTLPAPQKERR